MRPPKEEENKSQKDYRACREGTSGNVVPKNPSLLFLPCLNLGNGLGGGRLAQGGMRGGRWGRTRAEIDIDAAEK